MYYVYILRSLTKTDEQYIGYTDNLRRRMVEHNKGQSCYTRQHRPWRLCYYEAYAAKTDAIRRERRLKGYAKSYKMLMKRIEQSL